MERINNAPCGFMSLNHEGVIVYVNHTISRWLGTTEEALLNQHFEILLSKVSKIMFHSYFYPTIALQNRVEEMIIKLNNTNGLAHPYILNARKITIDGQIIIDCAFIQMDKRVNYEKDLIETKKLTQLALKKKEEAFLELENIYKEIAHKQQVLEEMNRGLEKLSTIDQLTGVYNRHFFENSIQLQLELFMKKRNVFSLVIVDIDFFKKVNDTYGHLVGDAVLARLAILLKEYTKGKGDVIRYGGEEFVLILPHMDQQESLEFAKDINKKIEMQKFAEVESITISLGVATVSESDSVSTLFKRADDALYFAKNNGRNQAHHFNDL